MDNCGRWRGLAAAGTTAAVSNRTTRPPGQLCSPMRRRCPRPRRCQRAGPFPAGGRKVARSQGGAADGAGHPGTTCVCVVAQCNPLSHSPAEAYDKGRPLRPGRRNPNYLRGRPAARKSRGKSPLGRRKLLRQRRLKRRATFQATVGSRWRRPAVAGPGRRGQAAPGPLGSKAGGV
jgi:hypothetical protein